MAKQDRITVDLRDLREFIQNYRSDSAWDEMSLSSKVRAMVRDAYENRNCANRAEGMTIAQIVCDHWEGIIAAGLDISGKRLKEIRSGLQPGDDELIELATALPSFDTHQLIEIRNRQFGGNNESGKPAAERV